jgi:hypothetical protein
MGTDGSEVIGLILNVRSFEILPFLFFPNAEHVVEFASYTCEGQPPFPVPSILRPGTSSNP